MAMIKTNQQRVIDRTKPEAAKVGGTYGERRAQYMTGSPVASSNAASPARTKDAFQQNSAKATLAGFASNAQFKKGIARFSKETPLKPRVLDRVEKGAVSAAREGSPVQPSDAVLLRFLDRVIKA